MNHALKFALIAACALAPIAAGAQTANNLAALKGLAPFAALPNSPAGQAALAANFAVTGGIQTGALRRPSLLPFADQQQQALKDVFITGGDLAELADGLGTTLGAAYVARAHYLDRSHFTNVSQAVADVIAYAAGDQRRRLQLRQVFLRQRHHRRQDAGLRPGGGDPQGREQA